MIHLKWWSEVMEDGVFRRPSHEPVIEETVTYEDFKEEFSIDAYGTRFLGSVKTPEGHLPMKIIVNGFNMPTCKTRRVYELSYVEGEEE